VFGKPDDRAMARPRPHSPEGTDLQCVVGRKMMADREIEDSDADR
jgi:hypothetical protein